MAGYVLGVDGGGTKTHCALFDMEGNKIDLVTWGPTNHEGMKGGFADLKIEMDKLLHYILDKNGISLKDIEKAVFGMAGVDTKKQHQIISEILRGLGVMEFVLCNDAFLGVKAGSRTGFGICAINGTGCTVAGIDPQGRMLQIGGQGELTGDKGGGGFLGRSAVNGVYNALFKDNVHTLMTDIIFEMLGITSKYDYMDALTECINSGDMKMREMGRVVFTAANAGDELALQILEHMGSEYARSITGAINQLDFSSVLNVNVILTGSVFVKGENPAAINRLRTDLLNRNPDKDINITILEQPPVTGAVIWAIETAGKETSATYSRVVSQL